MNRSERRQAQRDGKPLRDGFTVGQLKEAEAEMAAGAVAHQSSRGTTMSVLAHGWFALDHQREDARLMYQRTLELRQAGRDLKTDGVVEQYADAKMQIGIIEAQIVRALQDVAEEEGPAMAEALLGTTHMNMMTGIGVKFPEGIREQLAIQAGILEPPGGDAPVESQDNEA